mmetsp:Transcript_23709/g.38584  ORF Transcript_23709/g.38584 Transcript_23709/m.38584 type:complete len:100 (-) Transcript_23709:630-929(-)
MRIQPHLWPGTDAGTAGVILTAWSFLGGSGSFKSAFTLAFAVTVGITVTDHRGARAVPIVAVLVAVAVAAVAGVAAVAVAVVVGACRVVTRCFLLSARI